MLEALHKLPTIILLGALVVILAFLRKQHPTARFRLWLVGWVLIFIQSVTEAMAPLLGLPVFNENIWGLASVQLASILFMVSVSGVYRIPRYRSTFIWSLGGLMSAYALLLGTSVKAVLPYVVIQILVMISVVFHIRKAPDSMNWMIGVVITVPLFVLGVRQTFLGDPGFVFGVLFVCLNAATSLLFYRSYHRWTPGILATSFGFISTAATGTDVIMWSRNSIAGLVKRPNATFPR